MAFAKRTKGGVCNRVPLGRALMKKEPLNGEGVK